jgi:tetratricopeptide (TPR) repeat protein
MMKNKTRIFLFLVIAMLSFWSISLQAQEKKNLFTKDNLTVMIEHLSDTEGEAFKLFLKNPEKVNAVLGKEKAQYALREAISKAYFQGIDPIKKPNFDWTALKKIMKSKFGALGIEVLYGKQMYYYGDSKDWNSFGKYYVLYFEKALKRPEYIINNITWSLFENVDDQEVLKFACDVVMKYAIEEWYQNDPVSWDTYANLLYKTGKRDQAIEWEEKAVKMKIGEPDEKLYTDALDKMRKGIKTWPDTIAKL